MIELAYLAFPKVMYVLVVVAGVAANACNGDICGRLLW